MINNGFDPDDFIQDFDDWLKACLECMNYDNCLELELLDTICTENGHEYEFQAEFIGDVGVINGTMNVAWLECSVCGHQKNAEPSDYPDHYEDDWNYV